MATSGYGSWRQIAPIDTSGATRAVSAAGDLFNNAIASARQGVEDYKAGVQTRKDNLTNEFINRINAQNDLQNYDAFKQQLLQSANEYGNDALDLGKIQAAAEARKNDIFANIQNEQKMADYATQQESRPLFELIQNRLRTTQDPAEAQKLRNDLVNLAPNYFTAAQEDQLYGSADTGVQRLRDEAIFQRGEAERVSA